jgi:hypothetical protein
VPKPTAAQGAHVFSKRDRGFHADPARILADSRHDPADAVLALAAMCCKCKDCDASEVRCCRRADCPAHFRRPYQFDVSPRGAPHLERVEPHAIFGGDETQD